MRPIALIIVLHKMTGAREAGSTENMSRNAPNFGISDNRFIFRCSYEAWSQRVVNRFQRPDWNRFHCCRCCGGTKQHSKLLVRRVFSNAVLASFLPSRRKHATRRSGPAAFPLKTKPIRFPHAERQMASVILPRYPSSSLKSIGLRTGKFIFAFVFVHSFARLTSFG